MEYFQDPKSAWESDVSEFKSLKLPDYVIENLKSQKRNFDPNKYVDQLEKWGIKVLTIYEESYPKRLRQIYDPPIIVYYKGEFLDSDYVAIGVVGTRKITGYGRSVTEKFTQDLTSRGFTIISGLARGVDTVAHKTALGNKGRTIAVLGGGLNKIFPPENKYLADQISNGFGAVITEFAPNKDSTPGNFPSRNRTIAGLSVGVLVTEAAEDSGSLITARIALEEGRSVFAVPGPITSSLSKGPAELIKNGARLAFSIDDVLDELGIDSVPNINSTNFKLNETEEKVLICLENEGKHIDEICRTLNLKASEISSTLVKLEILGIVKNLGGGNYVKSF